MSKVVFELVTGVTNTEDAIEIAEDLAEQFDSEQVEFKTRDMTIVMVGDSRNYAAEFLDALYLRGYQKAVGGNWDVAVQRRPMVKGLG